MAEMGVKSLSHPAQQDGLSARSTTMAHKNTASSFPGKAERSQIHKAQKIHFTTQRQGDFVRLAKHALRSARVGLPRGRPAAPQREHQRELQPRAALPRDGWQAQPQLGTALGWKPKARSVMHAATTA